MFGLLLIVNALLDVEYGRKTAYESQQVKLALHENALKRYSRLRQSDREGESIEIFKKILLQKEEAVGLHAWFKMSFKCGISLIMSVLSTAWIISSVLPIVYIVVACAVSFSLIKTRMTNAKKLREKRRDLQSRIDRQNNFQYKKIRIGQGDIKSVIERKKKLCDVMNEIQMEWNKLSLLCSMPIILMSILSLLTCDGKPINLVILCMTMLKSVQFTTAFFNSYEDNMTKEEKYANYWMTKIESDLPPQYPIPETLKIIKYSFRGVDMWFNGVPAFRSGEIIRLTGASGAGKTTFINALKGVREGLILDHNTPLNYFNNISHLRQDIREAYHFSNISLSELFDDASEKNIIEALHVVGLMEWYRSIGSIYDDIKNNISGGEKTKLCLAITMLEGVRKQMLIMDEPEQGLDTEQIPQILENVFTWLYSKNPNLRIIFISHLCDCIVGSLPKHRHWHISRENDCFSLEMN